MSYLSALEQLHSMVPELYTVPGMQRRKFSLEDIAVLLGALGDPQKRFVSLLIAGTNGKGSTASTLASILRASGICTGLYTSPHLERPNERIRADGAEIADEAFARVYYEVQETAKRLLAEGKLAQAPSFFEYLTAMALVHFADAGVEIAVLEVGMGGRLDATNVVDPRLSILTDISLDHTEWLGETLTAIAQEKAGILRRGGTLIRLRQDAEVDAVLDEAAARLNVRDVDASQYLSDAQGGGRLQVLGSPLAVESPLAGGHQKRNLALAIAAAVELSTRHGLGVTAASIAAGIAQTRWPGRLERLRSRGKDWILDVAHNSAGVCALRSGLNEMLGGERPECLIFSCLRDKPLREMAETLFPVFQRVILVPIMAARAATMEDLKAAAQAVGHAAEVAGSVHEALKLAQSSDGVIVVSGSVYLVGEARTLLLQGGL
jgi:dihydrofolate synthase/folylpolyglutamate synthase